MEDIIPQSINDKINVLFTYVNNLFSSFANLTSNYFVIDDVNNQISVTGNTFTIDTTEHKINLGSQLNPGMCILHTDEENVVATETDVPNGSLFLASTNSGEFYLKIDSVWTQIGTIGNFKLGLDNTVSSTSGGSNFFGTSSAVPLSVDGIYEIEYNLYFQKNTTGTITFRIMYDYQPSHHIIHAEINDKVANITDTTQLDVVEINYNDFFYDPEYATLNITTESISDGDIKFMKIKLFVTNISLANTIDLKLYNSTGTTTCLKGSYWKSLKISDINSSV